MATKVERLRWFIAATVNIAPAAVTNAQMERFGEGLYAVDTASWNALTQQEKLDIAVAKARKTFVAQITGYERERDLRNVPPPADLPESP